MIEVTNVSKEFDGTQVLHDVDLVVPSGGLTALVGPSGSGKSTLLRIIAGLEQPSSGTVLIDGQDATRLPARRRGVGFVFQHYAAFKHLSVYENVAFGLRIRKEPKAEIDRRVTELLGVVGLSGYAKRLPSQLSGGQRQRMALARALAVQPNVLLLDEPFGALDANVRSELREWLRRLHDELHVTTVLVTHDQEEAMSVADQIAVMRDGRILQVGEPRELYDAPRDQFVMGFLGPVTVLGDRLVRPHDLHLVAESDAETREVLVNRVVHLGFEVRVELSSDAGEALVAQITRGEASELEIAEGDILYVREGGGLPLVTDATTRQDHLSAP